jgi:hypothetical protein
MGRAAGRWNTDEVQETRIVRRTLWLVAMALSVWTGRVSAQAVLPSGTVIPITLDEAVSLELKDAGKSYRARVARPVTVAGGTVIPAGAPARVVTRKPSGKPKQTQAFLAEVTVGGKAYQVPSQAARVEGSQQGAASAQAAGALGVSVSGGQAAAAAPTYVTVSPSAKRLQAGARLGFGLTRQLSLQ